MRLNKLFSIYKMNANNNKQQKQQQKTAIAAKKISSIWI